MRQSSNLSCDLHSTECKASGRSDRHGPVVHNPSTTSRIGKQITKHPVFISAQKAYEAGISSTAMFRMYGQIYEHHLDDAWNSLQRSDALLALLPRDLQGSKTYKVWAALLAQALDDLQTL